MDHGFHSSFCSIVIAVSAFLSVLTESKNHEQHTCVIVAEWNKMPRLKIIGASTV